MKRQDQPLYSPQSGGRRYSLSCICHTQGVTRQAHHKWTHRVRRMSYQSEVIISYVKEQRRIMPEIGGVKLYKALRVEDSPLIKGIGRDQFLEILGNARLLHKPRKYRPITTYSQHGLRWYPNIIKGFEAMYPCHILVADITYLRVGTDFCYVSLITDVYTRMILGYALSVSLAVDGSLEALKMAIKHIPDRQAWIHHTDRGTQYCCHAYTKTVVNHGGTISMTADDHAAENALAERVNGILKVEFHLDQHFATYEDARKALAESIEIYNTMRPHMRLNYRTPWYMFSNFKYAA